MKTFNPKFLARQMRKGTAVIVAVGLILSQALTGAMAAPAMPMAVPDMASQVGAVAAVRGLVTLARTGEVGRVVQSGAPIYLGDTISTDDKGQLQILLMDETVFTIGANSSMVIDQFVYDPSTDAGQIEATVTKGVFRFITGRIAKQKPENMEVHLPVGTIGVRGTIVAGEVSGKQSTVVLMGPGPNTTTDHRIGSFILENQIQNTDNQTDTKSTHVTRIGYATRIEGENAAPTPAFQAPEGLIQKITDSFSGSNEVAQQDEGSSENAQQNNQRQDSEGAKDPSMDPSQQNSKNEDGEPRPADSDQKDTVQGPNDPNGGGLGMGGVDDLGQPGGDNFKRGGDFSSPGNLRDNFIAKDILKVVQETTRNNTGSGGGGGSRLTTFQQMVAINSVSDGNPTTKSSFRQYFIDTNVSMTDGSQYKIAFNFSVDADNRTFGGGNSTILAVGTSNVGDFRFNLSESAYTLSGNAEITISEISNSAPSLCASCTGQLTVQFLNTEANVKAGDGIDVVATEVLHTVKVFNSSGDLLTQTSPTETSLSTRAEGTAPSTLGSA